MKFFKALRQYNFINLLSIKLKLKLFKFKLLILIYSLKNF